MSADVAAARDAAADYIEEHGWCQGRFKNQAGEVCLVGAIAMATASSPFELHELARVMAGSGSVTATWNDAPGRTQAEVVAKLREVAQQQREQP